MAAGGDIVNSAAHVGDVYQAVPLPRPHEVGPPPGVRPALPLRTRVFVGRAGKLAELDAALVEPGGAVVQAVHGLGGVGKSTLAAHWAHQHADDYVLTWWINAATEAGITAGLAGLAGMLVPEMTRSTPAASAVVLEERAAWARRWLAAHAGWLVVLDNVTRPADVAELLSCATAGRFLITSRLREGWHDLVPMLIELDVLNATEARELLRAIVAADRSTADLDGDAELCAELGYLPLAIQQAGACMHQTRLTPMAYLALLRDNPTAMYDQAARGSDAERTVARIWRITLDTLADTPLAGDLLRVLAWWAPDAAPRTLLAPMVDPIELNTALGDLAAYNMITLHADTVTVHRLVQAVARTADPNDPHRQSSDIDAALKQATALLHQGCPTDGRDPARWPTWRALLPHIDALADHTDPTTDTATTSELQDRTATYLLEQGAMTRAIAYFERALGTDERLHGPNHPGILASRNNLAYAYRAGGDVDRAIPLYEATLAECERVLGTDHPGTLTSRNNLANAYRASGDVDQAIPLYEATLADRERVLGTDHPRTLTSRSNLAGAYVAVGSVGDGLDRAIPLYEQTLADRERVLGTDHPDTLQSRNNLAYAYQIAGDLARAIPLHEQTLADRERVLGTDHPHTLSTRNNLAGAYRAVGDLDRAIPVYEQTLTDCEQGLGDHHPLTARVRANLEAARE